VHCLRAQKVDAGADRVVTGRRLGCIAGSRYGTRGISRGWSGANLPGVCGTLGVRTDLPGGAVILPLPFLPPASRDDGRKRWRRHSWPS
jgi:hypothetical protein